MSVVPPRSPCVGCAIMLLGGAISFTVSDDAMASHRKHVVHHRVLATHVTDAQALLPESLHLGRMRDYGGPKSPMWREVQ